MSVTSTLSRPMNIRFAGTPKLSFLYLPVFALCALFSQGAMGFSAACEENIKSMCPDVSPGGYRLTMCLLEKSSKLAPSCRPEVFASAQRSPDFMKKCRGDVAALCPKVSTTHGRIYSCLLLQESDLSPECKAQVSPALAR